MVLACELDLTMIPVWFELSLLDHNGLSILFSSHCRKFEALVRWFFQVEFQYQLDGHRFAGDFFLQIVSGKIIVIEGPDQYQLGHEHTKTNMIASVALLSSGGAPPKISHVRFHLDPTQKFLAKLAIQKLSRTSLLTFVPSTSQFSPKQSLSMPPKRVLWVLCLSSSLSSL